MWLLPARALRHMPGGSSGQKSLMLELEGGISAATMMYPEMQDSSANGGMCSIHQSISLKSPMHLDLPIVYLEECNADEDSGQHAHYQVFPCCSCHSGQKDYNAFLLPHARRAPEDFH